MREAHEPILVLLRRRRPSVDLLPRVFRCLHEGGHNFTVLGRFYDFRRLLGGGVVTRQADQSIGKLDPPSGCGRVNLVEKGENVGMTGGIPVRRRHRRSEVLDSGVIHARAALIAGDNVAARRPPLL